MDSSPAPRTGVRLMIVILIGMAMVALYANVRLAQRDKIEEVVVTPVPTAMSPGSPTPAPQ